jgi:hypothetical protein
MTVTKFPIATAPIAGEVSEDVFSGAVLATTEPADIAVITGAVEIAGTFAATEPPDTVAIEGTGVNDGDLAATEPADTAYFTDHVEGSFALDEPADTAAITAVVVVAGALDATEAADTLVIHSGLVFGTLDAAEAADGALFMWGEPAGGSSKRRRAIKRRQRQPASAPLPAPDLEALRAQRIATAISALQALANRYAAEGVDLGSLGFETRQMQEDEEDDAVTALLLTE